MEIEIKKAKEILDAFDVVKIEFTHFAGGKTEHYNLNEFEKKQCALVCANFLLKENLESVESERFYKRVITIIENNEIN